MSEEYIFITIIKMGESFETCMLVLMSASYERGIDVVSKT
jgi:hypothetical protein